MKFCLPKTVQDCFSSRLCWHWILSINLPFQWLPTSHCRLISFCKCRRKVRHLKSQNVKKFKSANISAIRQIPTVKFGKNQVEIFKLPEKTSWKIFMLDLAKFCTDFAKKLNSRPFQGSGKPEKERFVVIYWKDKQK